MFNMCLIFLSQKFIMQLPDSALFGSFLFFTLRSIRRSRRQSADQRLSLIHIFALELPLAQMQEMLGKAGFTLSHSSKFDIIVEYFVERGNYNVYEINEALFAFDQSLIGT